MTVISNAREVESDQGPTVAQQLIVELSSPCSETLEMKADRVYRDLILHSYCTSSPFGRLTTRSGKPLLTRTGELRRMVRIAAENAVASTLESDEVGYLIANGSHSKCSVGLKVLHLQKAAVGEMPLMTLFTENVLGDGRFARVVQVEDLRQGRILAAKVLKDPTLLHSVAGIHNEKALLEQIFRSSPSVRGIQKPPIRFFDFSPYINGKEGQKAGKNVGYITEKYDVDFYHAIDHETAKSEDPTKRFSKEEWIEGIRQLLEGLAELERQHICHGDIHNGNILFRRSESGEVEFVISDFGGSIDLNQTLEAPQTCTVAYLSIEDLVELDFLQKKRKCSDDPTQNRLVDREILALLLKRDVFAMGRALSFLLEEELVDKIIDIRGGYVLYELVSRMEDPDPFTRYTALQALEFYNNYYPRNGS